MIKQTSFYVLLSMAMLFVGGCMTHRQVVQEQRQPSSKTLIGEYDKGWIKYKIYLLPSPDDGTKSRRQSKRAQPIFFSIMIINMENGTSPLRRLCANLEEYNFYYAYLLTEAKNDIVLISGNTIQYPVSYSFENNYNAFPFETINVGYMPEAKGRKHQIENYRLFYSDKIFAHDTLTCNLVQVKS